MTVRRRAGYSPRPSRITGDAAVVNSTDPLRAVRSALSDLPASVLRGPRDFSTSLLPLLLFVFFFGIIRAMPINLHQRLDAALTAVEERQAKKARGYAHELKELAELGHLYAGDRDGVMQYAGAAKIGQKRAAGELLTAMRAVDHFPVAMRLLQRGRLFVGPMDNLLRLTKNASPEVQAEVDRRISMRLVGMDAGDAYPLIRTTLVEVETDLEAEATRKRQAKARANRGVWVIPVEDGMARIGAEVDALAARRFALDLDDLDRAQKLLDQRRGVKRTKAQRQADLLVELPARYRALLTAVLNGETEDLLAEARACAATDGAAPSGGDAAEGDAAPRAWDLPADELVVQLLRMPLPSATMLNVHVGAGTVLRLDDRACWIEGVGPAHAWEARLLLTDASLRRVLVDARSGLPVQVERPFIPTELEWTGHRRRRKKHRNEAPPSSAPPTPAPTPPPPPTPDAELRAREYALRLRHAALVEELAAPSMVLPDEDHYAPSARLRELVEVRDLRCSGPGCSSPATSCDLDHELEYAKGGATAARNLGAKSERCHGARHDGWTAVRDPRTGITTWTSPLGRVYTRLPAWRPHPGIPEGATIPPPRLEVLPEAETGYPEDRPLWSEPPAPGTPKATKPRPPTRPKGTWDDGSPPPF